MGRLRKVFCVKLPDPGGVPLERTLLRHCLMSAGPSAATRRFPPFSAFHRYDVGSCRDLLRVVRNKQHHPPTDPALRRALGVDTGGPDALGPYDARALCLALIRNARSSIAAHVPGRLVVDLIASSDMMQVLRGPVPIAAAALLPRRLPLPPRRRRRVRRPGPRCALCTARLADRWADLWADLWADRFGLARRGLLRGCARRLCASTRLHPADNPGAPSSAPGNLAAASATVGANGGNDQRRAPLGAPGRPCG